MRKIDRLPFGVHHCSALAHKATDDWFVECAARPEHDGPIRLSATAVRELARIGGLPTLGEYEAAKVERDLARARVEELEAQLVEADRFASAIDALESADFRARKKKGRPKQSKEVAA